MQQFIYIRGLRQAEHTVFCVEGGQKTYYDPRFSRKVPFSSGQQVKRSIVDSILSSLSVTPAPVTFNFEIDKKENLTNGEPWSPCDPKYPDQLLAGYMKAATGEATIKRRSPLSISALRPLHPLLSSDDRDTECISYDGSNRANLKVRVRYENGQELTQEELDKFLKEKNVTRSLQRLFIPGAMVGTRATGLFVYDIAIDMRTLFSVSLNKYEREITDDIGKELRDNGWKESKNAFGSCLICPKEKRNEIIAALAHGLINWRITSNQSRTFSLMETLAIAISDNANKVASAIRAKLSEETEKPHAIPIIDDTVGTDLFIALPCDGYIQGVHGTANALDDAENKLKEMLLAYDYKNQV
jgi:hypothetical protein